MTGAALRAPAALAGAALVLTACGSSGSGSAATRATDQLRQDVSALATAVANRRHGAAVAALTALDRQLATDSAGGTVSESRLARIRAAADRIRADLAGATVTPTPTPTASRTATPTPTVTVTAPAPPPKPQPKHGPGKHGGDGHGGGKGDG